MVSYYFASVDLLFLPGAPAPISSSSEGGSSMPCCWWQALKDTLSIRFDILYKQYNCPPSIASITANIYLHRLVNNCHSNN